MDRDQLRTEVTSDIDSILNNRVASRFLTPTETKVLQATRAMIAKEDDIVDKLLTYYQEIP